MPLELGLHVVGNQQDLSQLLEAAQAENKRAVVVQGPDGRIVRVLEKGNFLSEVLRRLSRQTDREARRLEQFRATLPELQPQPQPQAADEKTQADAAASTHGAAAQATAAAAASTPNEADIADPMRADNPPFGVGGIVDGHYVQRQFGNCCLSHAIASYFGRPVFADREAYLSFRNHSYDELYGPFMLPDLDAKKREELSDVEPVHHVLTRLQNDPQLSRTDDHRAPWRSALVRAKDPGLAADGRPIPLDKPKTREQIDAVFAHLATHSRTGRFLVRTGSGGSGHFQTLVYEPQRKADTPWTLLNSTRDLKTGLPTVQSGASPSDLLGAHDVRGVTLGIWTQTESEEATIDNGLLGVWAPRPAEALGTPSSAAPVDDDLPPPIFLPGRVAPQAFPSAASSPSVEDSLPPPILDQGPPVDDDLPPPILDHRLFADDDLPPPIFLPRPAVQARVQAQAQAQVQVQVQEQEQEQVPAQAQALEPPQRAGVPSLPPPAITNQKQLFDWLRLQSGTASRLVHYGAPVELAERAGNAREDRLFGYSDLVFRGDSRSPADLRRRWGGFTSRNDLAQDANRLESQGLGTGIGATGQSGVSTAKEFWGSVAYMSAGRRDGYIYVIDTRALPPGERAYDIESVVRHNQYPVKDVGAEVNITQAPMSAVMGWIHVPNASRLQDIHKNATGRHVIENLKVSQVGFNPDYKA